ncbi:N-Acetylneuraminate cytidylyltransferase [hydrothermal vent metagenome]|uniref:N-Acetylneuraminate cytidylyltransferase n=1 Tax=hydrothermal vent metagenome TaxID=652676 RepID=A0A3B0XSG5_9ZZZZ
MKVAIIPARGGSKRIPRKNIKTFCGKPIIVWSIEAAIQSACFDRVIVSTDDQEISDIAKQYGAEAPFVRPDSLSDDFTGTTEVVAHALGCIQDRIDVTDLACCIYATAPFIQVDDLKGSLKQIETEYVDYCFAVTDYAFPIQRSIRITRDRRCEMFQPNKFNQRSQDLEAAYHDAGQFYWGRVSAWLEDRPIFSAQAIPYVVPRYRAQDIDTPEDWQFAEYMFQSMMNKVN